MSQPFKALGVTVRDLLHPTGWMSIVVQTPLSGSEAFFVGGPGFSFLLELSDSVITLSRNGMRCQAPYALPAIFLLTWSPTEMAIHVNSKTPKTRVATPPTAPTLSLIRDLRKQGLLEKRAYATEEDFRSEVAAVLQEIQVKVDDVGSVDAFWNISKEGARFVDRKPKSEPEIQPILKQLLLDRAALRGFEIDREVGAAGGALDFLFVGSLVGGGLVRVPVECKLAHSKDLLRGITHQLPEYMRALGCSFGIYLVIAFKCRYFDQPAEPADQLWLLLNTAPDAPRDVDIRPIIIDASPRPPPSG